MKLEQLADLVRQMRAAQRLYFATHKPDALSRAKELERRTDQALKALADKQRRLFPSPPTGQTTGPNSRDSGAA